MTNANSIESKAKPFLAEIESFYDDLASKRGVYMAACKAVREEIKVTYGAAKEAGVDIKPLKAIIKRRGLERKIVEIPGDFDQDESFIYQALVDAFGALGEASARDAGYEVHGGKVRPGLDGNQLAAVTGIA